MVRLVSYSAPLIQKHLCECQLVWEKKTPAFRSCDYQALLWYTHEESADGTVFTVIAHSSSLVLYCKFPSQLSCLHYLLFMSDHSDTPFLCYHWVARVHVAPYLSSVRNRQINYGFVHRWLFPHVASPSQVFSYTWPLTIVVIGCESPQAFIRLLKRNYAANV